MKRIIPIILLISSFLISPSWALQDVDVDDNTSLDIVYGGHNGSTAESARINLGLEIGNDIQAYNANTDTDNTNDITDDGTGEIHAITEKTAPVSADEIIIEDSAASYGKKRVQIGTIPVADPVIGDPDTISPATTDYYGGTLIMNAAGTFGLPAVASGMNFTIVCEGANAVVLNPDATGTEDTIYLNGTAESQGENIDNNSTSGAICVFQYRSADAWMATCDSNWDGE